MRRLLYDSSQVQNQCHTTVSQDGAPGNSRNVLKGIAQALDDRFLLADQLVDHQTEALTLAFGHDQQGLARILGARFDSKLTVQAHYRGQITAHHDRLGPILNRENGVSGGPEHLTDGEQRHDIALAPYSHHQAVDDGEGQRHLKSERGTLSGAGLNLDVTAQFLDLPPDDIHPHATAGDVGNLRRGGETRLKYQVKDVIFRKMLGIGDQAFFEGLGHDARGVQTAPIVGYLDDDMACLVACAQTNAGHRVLARRHASIRTFDAMVQRVAHHVHEWIGLFFDYGAVDFSFLAANVQFRGLSHFAGQIADLPGHAR